MEAKEGLKLALGNREAAKALSISVRTLDRLRQSGKLSCVKVGSAVLFPVESLQKFLQDNASGSGVTMGA